MSDEEAWEDLDEVVWAHIRARRFDEAEVTLRELIERAEPRDPLRLSYLLGVLAGVLNNLERPVEGTELYRQALAEARRSGASNSVEAARYMLTNQLLIHGNPTDALAEAEPVPAGSGHVQCLLHSVAAQALWKLGRHEDARSAAKRAMDAAPTDERRSDLTEALAHIERAGSAVRLPTNHNSMEIPDERDLDERERALVRWLLEHGTPDATSYLSQVPLARAVSRCGCGCASLNLDIGGQGWRSPGGMKILSEHDWRDAAGRAFGIFVFAKANTLAGIEVYSMDGLSVPRELPSERILLPE
jgi:tetratricopeptide (TPR) repeat protein